VSPPMSVNRVSLAKGVKSEGPSADRKSADEPYRDVFTGVS
jgi:hypothetical protein